MCTFLCFNFTTPPFLLVIFHTKSCLQFSHVIWFCLTRKSINYKQILGVQLVESLSPNDSRQPGKLLPGCTKSQGDLNWKSRLAVLIRVLNILISQIRELKLDFDQHQQKSWKKVLFFFTFYFLFLGKKIKLVARTRDAYRLSRETHYIIA